MKTDERTTTQMAAAIAKAYPTMRIAVGSHKPFTNADDCGTILAWNAERETWMPIVARGIDDKWYQHPPYKLFVNGEDLIKHIQQIHGICAMCGAAHGAPHHDPIAADEIVDITDAQDIDGVTRTLCQLCARGCADARNTADAR